MSIFLILAFVGGIGAGMLIVVILMKLAISGAIGRGLGW